MADRLFTSKDVEDKLSTLQHHTKLEYGLLARIALAYSLVKIGANAPVSDDWGGKEIRGVSLFGNDELLYRSAINLLYQRSIEGDEFLSKRSVCKDHVDHGVQLLWDLFEESTTNAPDYLRAIAGLVPDELKRNTRHHSSFNIPIGKCVESGAEIVLELNKVEQHANSHMAIVGKPGVGKTQLLLKILSDIRLQSSEKTHFIYFDYKGDVAANDNFVEATHAIVYKVPKERLPINPFVLSEYDEKTILMSAREKTESLASISTALGPVQKGILTDGIIAAYKQRESQSHRFPDFREVAQVVSEMYQTNGRNADTLSQILRDLADFSLFHDHNSGSQLIRSTLDQTIIVDLHELPVLKELVAYLVIERLYKEITALPDSPIIDGNRLIRLVLVIDEAHNYLSQKNPFLQKIVRESRSKGVAVFFASQSPNDYTQKAFDFQELLEFSFMFQCDGASSAVLQDFLACSAGHAKKLQSEVSNLRPFEAFTRPDGAKKSPRKFKSYPFFKTVR